MGPKKPDLCGGLSKNALHRLSCLVTGEWRYLKGLAGLGGVALLEEVGDWGKL